MRRVCRLAESGVWQSEALAFFNLLFQLAHAVQVFLNLLAIVAAKIFVQAVNVFEIEIEDALAAVEALLKV